MARPIEITAGLFELSGFTSNISSSTSTLADAGNISIDADTVRISNGGNITSGPFRTDNVPTGRGGDVTIHATESVEILGPDLGFTGISATTFTNGAAGDVEINAPRVVVEDGGSIESSTQGAGPGGSVLLNVGTLHLTEFGQVESGASSRATGDGGDVTINANLIEITEFGRITAVSQGVGNAGRITLNVADELRVLDFGRITAEATQAFGGSIDITAGVIRVEHFSKITSSVQEGEGDGGNVRLSAPLILILTDSDIVAQAVGGNGGDIDINADLLIRSQTGTRIDASSERGVAGNVEIGNPVLDIEGALSALPEDFRDASELITERCSQRVPQDASQFVVESRRALPPGPDEPLPAFQLAFGDDDASYLAMLVGTTPEGRPVLFAFECEE